MVDSFILGQPAITTANMQRRVLLSSLLGVLLHAGLPVSVSGHGHHGGVDYAQGLAAPEQLRFWVNDDKHGGKDDDEAATLPFQFAGLNTFAKLPYADCFTKDDAEPAARYDIAILGAPHDTVRSLPIPLPSPSPSPSRSPSPSPSRRRHDAIIILLLLHCLSR